MAQAHFPFSLPQGTASFHTVLYMYCCMLMPCLRQGSVFHLPVLNLIAKLQQTAACELQYYKADIAQFIRQTFTSVPIWSPSLTA